MVLMPIDEGEVAGILRTLRYDCLTGWDGISCGILKRLEIVVVPPLTYIFNLIPSVGKLPNMFKKVIIHPIFEGGDGSCFNNYRLPYYQLFQKLLSG